MELPLTTSMATDDGRDWKPGTLTAEELAYIGRQAMRGKALEDSLAHIQAERQRRQDQAEREREA